MRNRQIVIAGASLGGLRAAEQLRAAGWHEGITIIGDEPFMPYNRPPLSKEALRCAQSSLGDARACDELHASTRLRMSRSLGEVNWRLGTAVKKALLGDRMLMLDDDEIIEYDGLVIATGLRPRRLPIDGCAASRFVLRNLEETVRLRRALTPGARVVIAGGGFIGCEVAATATTLGCEVTVVEPLAAPMIAALGAALAQAIQAHHATRGVRFCTRQTIAELVADRSDQLRGVVLTGGETVRCDVLVEAIGAAPNTAWLEGNGLDLTDGVLCDEWLRVDNADYAVAVGDIVRAPNARFGTNARRVEHWCVPLDTARTAAPTLVATVDQNPPRGNPYAPLPSFWSDQFDLRIHGYGLFARADEYAILEGDVASIETGVVVSASTGGRMTGFVALGMTPTELSPYVATLTEQSSIHSSEAA